MSPTSDSARRAAVALDDAAAAGVTEEELALWRHSLDPATLDICGCRTSLVALAVTLVFGLAVQTFLGFSFGRTWLSLTVAFLAATVAKIAGSSRAEVQLRVRLEALAAVSGLSSVAALRPRSSHLNSQGSDARIGNCR